MSDQATNVDIPDNEPSNVLDENTWQRRSRPYTAAQPPFGFIQLCADRRFHKVIMELFQQDTGLTPERYWIHADAGGAPTMIDQTVAPQYCYDPPRKVRLMAWCVHGDKCGGLPNMSDEQIETALLGAVARQAAWYPEAKHLIYFATISKGQIVVRSKTYQGGPSKPK